MTFQVVWEKVLKNGPSKICGRQPLKDLKGHGLLKQTISLQGCLPQILLGPILNTLSHTRNVLKKKQGSINKIRQ